MRRKAVQAEEKRLAFEKLVASGVTVAKAAWLSGIYDPNATAAQIAERMAEWKADMPAMPVVEEDETPEGPAK